MTRINRTLPLALALFTFILFEIVYYRPTTVFFIGILEPFIFFGAIYLTLGANLKTSSSRFKFLITPTLLVWSALAFSLLLEGRLGRHLLAMVVALFLVLFFESMFTYIWRHDTYQTYSLENLSAYALTLTVFLGSASLLGLSVLLDVHMGLIVFLALLLFGAVHYELVWMSKLPSSRIWLTLSVLTLFLLECVMVFMFLPFHFMVSGAALTVIWYTITSIVRASELGLLTKKMTQRHLVLGGGLLAVLLLATRWI